MSADAPFDGPVLALDSGSPVVSVAVARRGEVLAARRVEIGLSSQRLLPMIDEALAEAGVARRRLAGLVALAGPGSFTGLRVGLATALGIHQGLGVPAAAVPTLEALAWAAVADGGAAAAAADRDAALFALVDVLRDEWAVQEYAVAAGGLRRVGEAERLAGETVAARLTAGAEESAGAEGTTGAGASAVARRGGGPGAIGIGFGVSVLAERFPLPAAVRLLEPPALATTAARRASLAPPPWDAGSLTRPLYFRSPAVTLPKRRPAAAAPG